MKYKSQLPVLNSNVQESTEPKTMKHSNEHSTIDTSINSLKESINNFKKKFSNTINKIQNESLINESAINNEPINELIVDANKQDNIYDNFIEQKTNDDTDISAIAEENKFDSWNYLFNLFIFDRVILIVIVSNQRIIL